MSLTPRLATPPAAHRTAAERLLAVILRYPVLSALVLVVVVAALFAVLLQAGPPTQWFR